MNKTSIKNYAIWARNELISRVSQKAYEYGVEKENILPYDAQSINGRLLSDDEKKKRQILVNEVKHKGYDQVIEEIAYTWFNRFIALRFMEVNNYLPNKVRIFTNEDNEFKPQIIDEALHVDLLGLDMKKVLQLKESNNNEELYKELLLAVCNDMSNYLPGMFKPIDDYMTLLFPSNLLREESVLGRLISDIDEGSWSDQVQIIGWLYQYYNTELKDKTFSDLKRNIKITKETIPSATQLFTPDWIVRYMAENSLGRLWFDGHSDTTIKSNWKYYLDEAEQEESVQIELNKIKAEHAKLRPEDIKFLDPCMGSGHILVYAFDLFMQIYVSEGWTEREAAKSILQNNLFGLDIDERAYQLSYFALMMKARQYNRRILTEEIIPNVMAIEESNTFNRELLGRFEDLKPLAERVVNIFIDAKEYGSMLNVDFTSEELDSLENRLNEIEKKSSYGNLLDQLETNQLFDDFNLLLKQARIMSHKYDCVVTNPPYMGSAGMSKNLNDFIKKNYPDSKSDLFSISIEKCCQLTRKSGFIGMITQHSWMFLSDYKKLRHKLTAYDMVNMIHLGSRAFDEIGGEVVQTTSFVFQAYSIRQYKGLYCRLITPTSQQGKEEMFLAKENRYVACQTDFNVIPGMPIAYWVSPKILRIFEECTSLEHFAQPRQGMATCNNDKFLRLWYEPSIDKIGFGFHDNKEAIESGKKWFPYHKGGGYRKWYGNLFYVVDWEDDGKEIKNLVIKKYPYLNGNYEFVLKTSNPYFAESITWSDISTSDFACRYSPNGFMYDVKGTSMAPPKDILLYFVGLLNSRFIADCLKILNPTMSYQVGNIKSLPVILDKDRHAAINELVQSAIDDAKKDWDSFEISWEFTKHPLVRKTKKLEDAFNKWSEECTSRFNHVLKIEEDLNKAFTEIYNLQDEISYAVDESNIGIRKANIQREVRSLINYAVGCMFGRYSLDIDGLAYAGGEWDDSKYKSFIPDKDNIIPICDDEYFNDDITGRFIEFIKVTYGDDTLEENLRFIADVLGGKGSSREVIRNYFINDFYKDHCNTYQVTGAGKRPIYWQFDSGKKNGFKALIYIHRYTPDLIARMRTSYVHEQQSRYENQIAMIQNRIDSASSTSERVKAEKELKKLKEQADELRVYEEKIHHWADKMEPMNLDDGVKANYAKFQELLTKIK